MLGYKKDLKLIRTRSFMYLRRQIPPHEADAIMAANVVGVRQIVKEYKRF